MTTDTRCALDIVRREAHLAERAQLNAAASMSRAETVASQIRVFRNPRQVRAVRNALRLAGLGPFAAQVALYLSR